MRDDPAAMPDTMRDTVRAALFAAGDALRGVSDTPRLDAELLMAHALGLSRDTLILSRLDDPEPDGFAQLLARRSAQEPTAYITGKRDFWTITLEVGPGVLVPRADSETLIEAALDHFGAAGPATILDLGTGPGTLLLAALDQWPRASGLGVERSYVARGFATRNAMRIAPGRAEIREGDWAKGVAARFDLVLCNPPYVESGALLDAQVGEYEPHEALFAGEDGLDDYRILAGQLRDVMAPGGIAILEIGAGQEAAVSALMREQNFAVTCRTDLGGRPRALILA
ncbi:release factor glutamine methyltransferase [Stakelama pacifica]|uniref:peptide chain release factor N(5)-glutamine methyltransferase n=2 Tax=Stakelama pacifica TaxID=517720 RepID=A0A4R6F9V0_9SPHN|nr:release factor glutamine methyltransferase [Stakelama pacifica]GGP00646.1 release factor glutamine methyltransferase [Stakelama pacifica]